MIFGVENITVNSTPKNDVLVTATPTISDFGNREVDGQYLRPRLARLVEFGFDTAGSTEVSIGYAELICNYFRLLDG